jgi:hypothetical protein
MQIYRIEDVAHPYEFNKKIRTLVGPGLISSSVHKMLSLKIDAVIPEQRLLEIGGQLEHIFVMGRRAVQTEMRHALGIKREGDDFRPMGD